MHNTRIVVPDQQQLLAAAHLVPPPQRAQALGHLNWCARTPYALVRTMLLDSNVVGYCTAVQFATSARMAQLFVHPELRGKGLGAALASAVGGLLRYPGPECLLVQCAPEQVGFWEGLGFVVGNRFVHYGGGLFVEAQRDEVQLLQPAHALALLHLDRKATGEDRAPLLLEHRYAAQGYVEENHLRGCLLPVLGHGCIVADSPQVGLELQRWLLPVQERIIVPEANEAACVHLRERGYRVQAISVRMVRGAKPDFRPEMVFAWPF